MKVLVLVFSFAMPVVAWFAQRGAFGPDNGTISAQYPTLIVAAGYAFSIWGVIFLLDAVFGIWQLLPDQAADPVLRRIRPAAAAGFALTTGWMIVFPQEAFWLALLIIWLDLACLLYCAALLGRSESRGMRRWIALAPLSLHAGWLSLAALLNLAQVIVAYRLLPTDEMLGWSLPLLLAAASVLLFFNHRAQGNAAFALAGVWGLVAVYVRQSGSNLAGAPVTATVAAFLAALLALQTGWLLLRRR